MRYPHPISERQKSFITALCAELGRPGDAEAFFVTSPSSAQASDLISRLLAEKKALPRPVAAAVPAAPALPMPSPGYYAVHYGDRLNFYRVADGKGRWAGRRFLNRYRSEYLARIPGDERAAVTREILADEGKAALRFAQELTRCYCCGRMLTDETSRLRGIGPECYGKGRGKDVIGMDLLPDLTDLESV